MAGLTRQRSVASIGPIGVVQPTAYMAQAAASRDAAYAIGQMRSRYLGDVLAGAAEDRRVAIEQVVLDTTERWTEKFYEYRPTGDWDGFNRFMEVDTDVVLESVPENLRDDVGVALQRVRMSQTGDVREEQYKETLRLQRLADHNLAMGIVADFAGMAGQAALQYEGDPAGLAQHLDNVMEELVRQVPEEHQGAALVDMTRITTEYGLDATKQLKAKLEEEAKGNFGMLGLSIMQNVDRLIREGASPAEVGAQLSYMQSHFMSGVGTVYDNVADATAAFRQAAMNPQASILGQAALASGDPSGFLSRWASGQDQGVPDIGGYMVGTERQTIAGMASGMVSGQMVSDTEGDQFRAAMAVRTDEDVLENSPWEYDPSKLAQEGPLYSTDPSTDGVYRRKMADAKTEADYLMGMAEALANPLYASQAQAAWAATSPEDQKKALGWIERSHGWTADELIEGVRGGDPTKLDAALTYMTDANVVLPGVTAFFGAARTADQDTDPVMLRAWLQGFNALRRNAPGIAMEAVGSSWDLLEKVDSSLGGIANDPQIVRAAFIQAAELTRPAESIEASLARWDAFITDPVQVTERINQIYVEGRLANRYVSSWLHAGQDKLHELTANYTERGDESLFADAEIRQGLPGIFAPHPTGLSQSLGSQVWDAAQWVLTESGNPMVTTIDDPMSPRPGTRAWEYLDNQTRIRIRQGIDESTAFRQTMVAMERDGWGFSAFAPESVVDAGLVSGERVMEPALVQYPFEANVPNVEYALVQIAIKATDWLRTQPSLVPSGIDIVGAIEGDHATLVVEPVADFKPSDPKFIISVLPKDERAGFTGAVVLFDGQPWSYDQQFLIDAVKNGHETAVRLGLGGGEFEGMIADMATWATMQDRLGMGLTRSGGTQLLELLQGAGDQYQRTEETP